MYLSTIMEAASDLNLILRCVDKDLQNYERIGIGMFGEACYMFNSSISYLKASNGVQARRRASIRPQTLILACQSTCPLDDVGVSFVGI